MNAFSKIDMGEVTRLTQAGKLAEAMALLQGHPASSIARGSPDQDMPSSTAKVQGPLPSAPTIDMVAPSVRVEPGPLPSNPISELTGGRGDPSGLRRPQISRRRCCPFATAYPSWARFPA